MFARRREMKCARTGGFAIKFLMKIDRYDAALLRLLQRDARRSLEILAHEVGLSVASVGRRLNRLRKAKVIVGEVAIVDPQKAGCGMTFVVQVELVRDGATELEVFKEALAREPLVQQYFYVTGDADFILVVRAKDMGEFEGLSKRLFLEPPNVKRFKTSVCLRPAPIMTEVRVDASS